MAKVARCIVLFSLRNVLVLYLGFYNTVSKAHDAYQLNLGDDEYSLVNELDLDRSRRQVQGNDTDINNTIISQSTTAVPQVTDDNHTEPIIATSKPEFTTHTTSRTQTTRGTTKSRFLGDIVENHHRYYSSSVDTDRLHYEAMWKDLESLSDAKQHDVLSRSYRVAATIKLEFPFRFYGHQLTNLTIATGGFLYMSPYLHRFLTATQYIAPLMANFDASIGSKSHIYYHQNKHRLRVQWSNIYLQDQKEVGPFTFQVILFSSNAISFVYNKLPVKLTKIKTKRHPVKIGLSDAYYVNVDRSLEKLGRYRPTIFEYHNVKINKSQIRSGIVVRFRPHKTCNMDTTCSECIKERANFDCRWCTNTKSCSDGFDWNRHRWLVNRCHDSSKKYCPGVAPTAECCRGKKFERFNAVPPWAVAVIIIVLLLAITIGVGGWVYYAYTHPTSRSGLWLIKHRPSQMKQTLSKMKFWKRGSSGEERYGVETTA